MLAVLQERGLGYLHKLQYVHQQTSGQTPHGGERLTGGICSQEYEEELGRGHNIIRICYVRGDRPVVAGILGCHVGTVRHVPGRIYIILTWVNYAIELEQEVFQNSESPIDTCMATQMTIRVFNLENNAVIFRDLENRNFEIFAKIMGNNGLSTQTKYVLICRNNALFWQIITIVIMQLFPTCYISCDRTLHLIFGLGN